jgi:hypothetical protein
MLKAHAFEVSLMTEMLIYIGTFRSALEIRAKRHLFAESN